MKALLLKGIMNVTFLQHLFFFFLEIIHHLSKTYKLLQLPSKKKKKNYNLLEVRSPNNLNNLTLVCDLSPYRCLEMCAHTHTCTDPYLNKITSVRHCIHLVAHTIYCLFSKLKDWNHDFNFQVNISVQKVV